MSNSSQRSFATTRRSSPGSAGLDEIAQFRVALDAIIAERPSEAEIVLDAVIDFFACRCQSNQHLQALGVGLFAALNSQTAATVTTGVFDEQFDFDRDQDVVRIAVDRQQLAAVPLDVAIRLATLLHGARQSNVGRSRAA